MTSRGPFQPKTFYDSMILHRETVLTGTNGCWASGEKNKHRKIRAPEKKMLSWTEEGGWERRR